MSIRDSVESKDRAHLLNSKALQDKQFGTAKNEQTWSNREADWYNAERRLIFACESKEEALRWMHAIKKAAAPLRAGKMLLTF